MLAQQLKISAILQKCGFAYILRDSLMLSSTSAFLCVPLFHRAHFELFHVHLLLLKTPCDAAS